MSLSSDLRRFFACQLLAFAALGSGCVSAQAQSLGERILFVSDRNERPGLYQMNADGSDATLLHEQGGPAEFSPDGSKIAFLWRGPENGPREIYIMNSDGSGVRQLTESGDNPVPDPDFPHEVVIGPESISFHPQGDRIVFADRGEIYLVRIDGSAAPQQLTTHGMGGLTDKETPVFSRDGTRIVFVGLTETEESDSGVFILNWDLYAISANGSGLTRLTTHPGSDLAPRFSHDGNRIVFVRQDDPSAGLYTMSSVGGAATPITSDPNLTYLSATFSPDDMRIVFDASTSAGTHLFVTNASGSGVSRLTNGTGYNASPMWGLGEVGATLRVSAGAGKITEGNSSNTEALFTVRLSSACEQPVSVHVSTTNGTATAGEDFNARSEVITLAPGEVERSVHVAILGDLEWEVSETFFLDLTEMEGATISVGRASALIVNDDPIPAAVGRLAFASGGDIFVMNADGSAIYNLTDTPEIGEGSPVWSPDGSRIAFVSADDGLSNGTDIFVINADGSGRARLTNTPNLSESSPSWSPDGRQIVFESNGEEKFDGNVSPDFNFQIYIINADGRGRKRVTRALSTFPMPGKNPVWAATGKIYFADHRDGAAHILSINPNGTGERSLLGIPTDLSDTVRTPAISPDGSKIAFVQMFLTDEGADQSDVMLMNADGSGLVNLTDDPAFDVDPTFSPDGTKLVFSSTHGGSFDLYSIPVPVAPEAGVAALNRSTGQAQAARAQALRITTAAGDERDADWDRRSTSIPTDVQVSVGKRVLGEGQKTAVFTVRLSKPATSTSTIQFATEDGTAKAGGDYTAQSGTLSFARGQRSRFVRVPIINDALDEEQESFSLKLTSLDARALATAQGTILDDDPLPRVHIAPLNVLGPGAGAREALFTVRLSAQSTRSVTVAYRSEDGSAKAPSDYTSTSGTVLFAPGETEKVIAIAVHADGSAERAETLYLKVTETVNCSGKGQRARAMIP